MTMRPSVSPEAMQSAGGRGNKSSPQAASSPINNIGAPTPSSFNSGSRPSTSWWACGQSLPSAPLINVHPVLSRRPCQSVSRSAGSAFGRQNRRRTARASIDRSRQRVFDVEVFISHLVKQPRAFFTATVEESGPCDEGRRLPRGDVANRRMDGSHPSVTDYHCETVGLMDDGYRVSD